MGGAQTVPLSDYVMPLVAIMGVAVATSVSVNEQRPDQHYTQTPTEIR